MKKTRLVGLLLVLVLVTSCFAGGTFAKYTSQASGSDTAVVAKWSIFVNDKEQIATNSPAAITFDLFATINDTGNTDEADVIDNKIAPGTEGSFKLTVLNASEVNAKYKIDLIEYNDHAIPLQYKIDNGNWSDSIADITNIITDKTLNMGNNAEHTVYWRWVFENTTTTPGHTGQTDSYDTALGILGQGTAPQVTISATITVEQVD